MLWQKKRYEEKNSMFALIRGGRPNILFGGKLRNSTQYPAQSSFCPAQFASKITHNFTFFSAPSQKPCNNNNDYYNNKTLLSTFSYKLESYNNNVYSQIHRKVRRR